MPKCAHCGEWFYKATASSPAESCYCAADESVEDLRADGWDIEPTEDELEERRHGRDGTVEP